MKGGRDFEVVLILFQDLQDEVEQHRDMYLSLDSTGKKLVSGLDTQEDATILARRLEEMNQRWGYLKAKSMAIRWEQAAPSNIVTCDVFVFSGIVPLESLRIWHYNRTKLFVTFNYFPRLKLYISLGGTKYTRFEDILTFYNFTCPGPA